MASRRIDKAAGAAAASARVKYTRKAVARDKAESHKEPPPRLIGNMQVCWCGKPSGHRYKGAKDGAPHPPPERRPSPPALGHQCVLDADEGFTGTGHGRVVACIICGKRPS